MCICVKMKVAAIYYYYYFFFYELEVAAMSDEKLEKKAYWHSHLEDLGNSSSQNPP